MRAFMCDVCSKADKAREESRPADSVFGFSVGEQTVQLAPLGWYGVSRVMSTGVEVALCCSTDCVLRFVHRPLEVST